MLFELKIGLRYLVAAKGDRFVSFVSIASFLGVALGVAALVVVMSVMNGFQIEVRERILSVEPHVQAWPAKRRDIPNWRDVGRQIMDSGDERIVAVAPGISEQALLSKGNSMSGIVVKGVFPEAEGKMIDLGGESIKGKSFEELIPGEFEIIVGRILAAKLDLKIGDRVLLIAPKGRFTPAGLMPRVRQFDLVGVFESGVHQYDASFSYAHVDDIGKIYGYRNSVQSIQVRLDDLFDAASVVDRLSALGIEGVYFSDWSDRHQSLFRALAVEKRVMFIILSLIIAVAAFNIVTALAMNVRNRRGDIAILRTFGARSGSIVSIFMLQGALIGIFGIALGVVGGTAIAGNIDAIMGWAESAFGFDMFPSDVYILDNLPAKVDTGDVARISIVAFVISFLATLYPSFRAARVLPSEVLRHE